MKSIESQSLKLPVGWNILPAYLTLWSLVFSLYGLIDGNGMMENFGIDTGGASDFIMLNSASRYMAISISMIFGIWIIRTFGSILTALIARFVMDILDLYSGIVSGAIEDYQGVLQSFLMFLIPGLISLIWLLRIKKKVQI